MRQEIGKAGDALDNAHRWTRSVYFEPAPIPARLTVRASVAPRLLIR